MLPQRLKSSGGICSQFYERFYTLQTSIYLSVSAGLLKSLVVTSVVKFNALMLVFTFKYKLLSLTSIGVFNFATLVA